MPRDAPDPVDWSALHGRMSGEVILPGDDRLVLANKQHAGFFPLPRPRALIRCQRLDDVRSALAFLVEQEIPFAVRSGGHCFGDLSSSTGAVIDLAEMDAVELDGEVVRLGPGALSRKVSRALAARGRVLPTGGCPWVAVAGLSLVGGFGFLGRRHGLTTDRLLRAQVVCAEGRVVWADAEHEPDLFWALRGAGAAGFGIVTRLELRTAPLEPLTACYARWPLDRAPDLIAAWQHWAPDAHDDVSLELGLFGDEDPDEPAFVELYGAILGPPPRAERHLTGLRRRLGAALARELRTWSLPLGAAADYLVGLLNHETGPFWEPSRPFVDVGAQFTRSHFFDTALDRSAIEACVARFAADRRRPQYRELELVPWRGAYARENPGACFVHRSPRLLIRHTCTVGARATPELRDHARDWVDASSATLAPCANGHVYQGYADRRLNGWAEAYHGDAFPRLRRIKRRYDPDNVFRHAQSIPPAADGAGASRSGTSQPPRLTAGR